MSKANDVLSAVKKNINFQRRENSEWVGNPENYKFMVVDRVEGVLKPFLSDGSRKKTVPSAFGDISYWYLRQALDEGLGGLPYPEDSIAKAGIYKFWHIQCLSALMQSSDPGRHKLYLKDFNQVSFMLALGWPSRAVSLAETLFDRWEAQEGGSGAISWDSLPQYVPWLSVKLFKSWRDIDLDLDFEPDGSQLGGFADLAENLLHEDTKVFRDALLTAADFHAQESGTKDYDAVREYTQWFFPIELLAACRIRELRGLEVPYVEHPLLETTPLCRLPPSVAIPRDDILEKALEKFSQATGKLNLRV